MQSSEPAVESTNSVTTKASKPQPSRENTTTINPQQRHRKANRNRPGAHGPAHNQSPTRQEEGQEQSLWTYLGNLEAGRATENHHDPCGDRGPGVLVETAPVRIPQSAGHRSSAWDGTCSMISEPLIDIRYNQARLRLFCPLPHIIRIPSRFLFPSCQRDDNGLWLSFCCLSTFISGR